VNIQQGMTVRTKFGEVGVVRSMTTANGARFYRLQQLAGQHLTRGYRLVADSEIVAIKAKAPIAEAISA
jgi:hypothetical protein